MFTPVLTKKKKNNGLGVQDKDWLHNDESRIFVPQPYGRLLCFL